MRKLITLLLTAFITTVSFSQEFKQGKVIDDKSLFQDDSKTLGVVDGNIYTMSVEVNTYSKGDVSLVKIDKDLNLVFNKKLDFKVPGYTDYYVHLFEDKIYMMYIDPSLLTITYYYQVFDLDGNVLENKEIGSLSLKEVKVSDKYNNFTASPNGEFLSMVVGTNRNSDVGMNIQIIKLTLGENIGVEQMTSSVDFKGFESTKLTEVKMDNDGNFIGIVQKKMSHNDIEMETEMIVLNEKGNLLKRQEIKSAGYYFRNFKIEINEDNKIKFAGSYYSLKGKKNYFNGFFIADYDIDLLEFSNENFKPLSGEILSVYGEPNKKGEYDFWGSFDSKIEENNDGTGYLIVERYGRGESYTMFAEIFVIPYGKNNEFGNFVYIPKRQQQSNSYSNSGSYYSYVNENILHLYFNANEKIVDAKNNDDLRTLTIPFVDSKTFLCKVDQNGGRDFSVFEDNSKSKLYLDTRKSFSKDGSNVLVKVERKKLIYGKFD